VHLSDHRPLVLSGTPFLVTVHDVFFLDRPDWYPRSVAAYKRAMLSASLRKRPTLVACVSEYTRERLLAHHPEAARVARVLYPGVAVNGGREESDEAEPYFLTVATIEPRKNHLTLLEAFQAVRRRGFELRWKVAGVGKYRSDEILPPLLAADGVDVLGHVSSGELERLYRGAHFVAVPSWAEGFGYPALEAMARGVPVACATGSAADESAGDAAVRLPPDDADAWAEALRRLAEDAGERDRLRALGRERVASFSWAAAAAAYVEAYRDVAA
jgi:glycosyltransferase involved in cell wall biosynthesis